MEQQFASLYQSPGTPELMTVASAARRLGISLNGFVRSAPVQIHWLGGRRYCLARDLEAWLDGLRKAS